MEERPGRHRARAKTRWVCGSIDSSTRHGLRNLLICWVDIESTVNSSGGFACLLQSPREGPYDVGRIDRVTVLFLPLLRSKKCLTRSTVVAHAVDRTPHQHVCTQGNQHKVCEWCKAIEPYSSPIAVQKCGTTSRACLARLLHSWPNVPTSPKAQPVIMSWHVMARSTPKTHAVQKEWLHEKNESW